MRKVIVNSTPIISLSKAGCLYLLKELYSSLIFVCVVYYGRGMEVHNSNDVSVYDAG